MVAGTAISSTEIVVKDGADSSSTAILGGGSPSGGNSGAWNLVSTVTASNVSTVDFPSLITSSYKQYVLVATEVWTDSGSSPLFYARFMDGASQNNNASYFYSINQVFEGSGPTRSANSLQNQMLLVNRAMSSNVNPRFPMNFNMWIMGGNRTDFNHSVYWTGSIHNDTNFYAGFTGMGGIQNASSFTANGIRITTSVGNFYGTFKLYGIN